MPVKIEFSTANAAFAEDWRSEAELIIARIAESILYGLDGGRIRDSNGNTIGQWSATIDAEESER